MTSDASGARFRTDHTETAWTVLLLVGSALFVAGATDVLLLFWPTKLGNLEWEFGTASALFNGMPVPTMGVSLVLAAGMATHRLGAVMVALVWTVIMTLVLAGISILYLLNIPLALRSVGDDVARAPLITAIVKGCVSSVTYLALNCALAYISARFLRKY